MCVDDDAFVDDVVVVVFLLLSADHSNSVKDEEISDGWTNLPSHLLCFLLLLLAVVVVVVDHCRGLLIDCIPLLLLLLRLYSQKHLPANNWHFRRIGLAPILSQHNIDFALVVTMLIEVKVMILAMIHCCPILHFAVSAKHCHVPHLSSFALGQLVWLP